MSEIYSPTRTDIFDFCHLKHDLVYEGGWLPNRLVRSRNGGNPFARFIGSAFAAGVAQVNRTKLTPAQPWGDPVASSLGALAFEIQPILDAGVEYDPADLDEAKAKLTQAIEKYIESDPIIPKEGWDTKDVELTLPDHGNARIDWGGYDRYGVKCQIDYKLKLNLEARWKDKEIERWRYSTQMLHYCWAYGVQRYYICAVILAPRFSIETWQYEVDPELMQAWLASSRQKWSDMGQQARGERVPDMANTHRDAYGDCPYQRACLEFKLDEGLMATEYIQVRRPRATETAA